MSNAEADPYSSGDLFGGTQLGFRVFGSRVLVLRNRKPERESISPSPE